MRILALDTSTEFLTLALFVDGASSVREVHAGQRHSELALPLLGELLSQSGLALSAFDAIAFGQGPGSFTGVRIACGIAQGLAFGADLPVVGIPTLLALAAQSDHTNVMASLDARMGEVYYAAYRKVSAKPGTGAAEVQAEDWEIVSAPGLYSPQHLPALAGLDWIGLGNGFQVADGAVAQHYAKQLRAVHADRLPHAREIARLGADALVKGKGVPAWEAAPLYIRDKVALKTSER